MKVWFYSNKIEIGENTLINRECFFHNVSSIRIGDNVSIGPRVIMTTVNHETKNKNKRAGDIVSTPIEIQDSAWIGANVTILPGVTVGKGAIVAAGAVVLKDVEENTLVGGVPASFIKNLNWD